MLEVEKYIKISIKTYSIEKSISGKNKSINTLFLSNRLYHKELVMIVYYNIHDMRQVIYRIYFDEYILSSF